MEKEFDKKYESLMNNRGIILFNPMSDQEIQKTIKLLETYPHIDVKVIKYDAASQILVRYYPLDKARIDINFLIKLGNIAYEEEDYDECILCYLEVLEAFSKPKAFIYAKIGLAYLKKNNKKLAIDYLKVATYLAQEDGSVHSYTKIISRLSKIKEDKKRRVTKTRKKSKRKVDDYYGIDFIAINNYIIESKLDVESACQKMNVPLETINIIKLIYAREFYKQGNVDKGDEFLSSVENSKFKTQKTLDILLEISQNKQNYIDESKTQELALSLVLTP